MPTAALPATTTPAPTPTATPTATPAATPAPPAPKPSSEVEKWLAQVDAAQQVAWQKDVIKLYEGSVAALRAKHVATLDDAFTKATKAGNLRESVAWRNERQAFEATQNVGKDEPADLSSLRTVRASFRQQLAAIEASRASRAKALHKQYDDLLAQNQTALVQAKRLADAELLQARRDEIARAWLGLPDAAAAAANVALPARETPLVVPDNSFLLASKERPLVNELGMKFVPVPISGGPTDKKRVLFSIWETRVQDYEVFIAETKTEWPKPTFPQGPLHPAGNVAWRDTQAFCDWLTQRERQAGRLRANERYRLPTDHEWSCAVVSKQREDAKLTPLTKSGKIRESYPWGPAWPPPRGAGNYCGEECTGGPTTPYLKDHRDDFPTTAPVGSFLASKLGLYDLGGNVWEWCDDLIAPDRIGERVTRGASYLTFERGPMWWSARFQRREIWRDPAVGFRVVLAPAADVTPKLPSTPAPASPFAAAPPIPPPSAVAPAPAISPVKATAPVAPAPAPAGRAVTATPVPLVPKQHVLTELELKKLLESTEWSYFTSPEPDAPPTGSIIFHREGKRGSCLSNNAFNAIVWYETEAPDLILIYHTGMNAPKPLVRVFRLDVAARVARFDAGLSNIAGKGCIKFKGPAKSR
jgi:hypothetical protein